MQVDLCDHHSLMDWWKGAFWGGQIYTYYKNNPDHASAKKFFFRVMVFLMFRNTCSHLEQLWTLVDHHGAQGSNFATLCRDFATGVHQVAPGEDQGNKVVHGARRWSGTTKPFFLMRVSKRNRGNTWGKGKIVSLKINSIPYILSALLLNVAR